MWRISDDFWDDWKALRLNFILMSIWSAVGRPGAWPDADMLPLGRIGIRAHNGADRMTRLTRDEQRTLMSLWSIAQSPLMFGGDLPSNDDLTLSLITNDEVLAVDQQGAHGRALSEDGERIIWIADAGSNAKYVAIFNIGNREPASVQIDFRAAGLPSKCTLRDLWDHKDLGTIEGGRVLPVPPHGSGLYKISAVK